MTADEEFIPLSALQHWRFCPRQCGLIHLDGCWTENELTALGRRLHERVDTAGMRSSPGTRIEYAVPLRSVAHGLCGIADVVEFRCGVPYPVEYKRGCPKSDHCDEIQLCAQALCLEEMCNCPIAEGALFYGAERRRIPVIFTPELRELTLGVVTSVRRMLESGAVPLPTYAPERCDRCSLLEDCRPGDPVSAAAYLEGIE